MYLQKYLTALGYDNLPEFLEKYLKTPSLIRLKKVGYFCGMDYASKDVYNFSEYISRYDHSLTVALITYKFTNNKTAVLAGLFHDIATPCFSHVIDYMNGDYSNQESTEKYTEHILRADSYLQKCLEEDNIKIDDIINFKKFTIVDNDRPKVCADRIDGVILTGTCWTKNISIDDISKIVDDMKVYTNEFGEQEIGFKTSSVAKKVLDVSQEIDVCCHSREDNFMMQLLAEITKSAINKKYISYNDLYNYNEEEVFDIFKSQKDSDFEGLISKFENMKKDEIPNIDLPYIKARDLNPIADGVRIK